METWNNCNGEVVLHHAYSFVFLAKVQDIIFAANSPSKLILTYFILLNESEHIIDKTSSLRSIIFTLLDCVYPRLIDQINSNQVGIKWYN